MAQYTAQNFPSFIKALTSYKENNLSQALEDAFLQFDASLTEETVIHTLKELAGFTEQEREEGIENPNDAKLASLRLLFNTCRL